MTYKGLRIDRKYNVYDLNGKKIAERCGSLEEAKAFVDEYLEQYHKK